jgi:hypothetical protein
MVKTFSSSVSPVAQLPCPAAKAIDDVAARRHAEVTTVFIGVFIGLIVLPC